MSLRGTSRRTYRRGFTLLEALMSSGILFVVVLAVTSAILAGHQGAFEAHERIAATLAVEDLGGRLLAVDYDDLSGWHGYVEDVGTMTTTDETDLPTSFGSIGRRVTVTLQTRNIGDLEVEVEGRRIRVDAFDVDDRVLATIERFVPEPSPEQAGER